MMSKASQSITAAELMARLQADPEWVRKNAEREASQRAAVEKLRSELRPEQEPLLHDLGIAGYELSSVWDLVNLGSPYRAAIPVLLAHLASAQHPVLRNGIARALAVQEAEGIAAGPVIDALKVEKDPEVRWALANTLTIVAAKNNASQIAALVESPEYADVRERLQQALKNAIS